MKLRDRAHIYKMSDEEKYNDSEQEYSQDSQVSDNENEVKSFVVPISDEQRRMYQLKFKLYLDGIKNPSKGNWAGCSVDLKEKQTIWKGSIDLPSNETKECDDRMELIALIESLRQLFSTFEEAEKKFVKVSVYSDSVYVINVAREWIGLWKDSAFANRPNADLLAELEPLLNIGQLDFTWVPQDYCEEMQLCKSLCS